VVAPSLVVKENSSVLNLGIIDAFLVGLFSTPFSALIVFVCKMYFELSIGDET